jgi:protein-S-isoprenylcysteine O-methyltransferase Ste14
MLIIWGLFWAYWLIAAIGAKQGTRGRRWRLPGLLLVATVIVDRLFARHGEPAHSLVLQVVGTGPYKYIRHPIYSGLLLGVLGTAIATNFYWVLVLVLGGIYFVYSARVEEGLMESAFPTMYPEYRASTKMLIPFVL